MLITKEEGDKFLNSPRNILNKLVRDTVAGAEGVINKGGRDLDAVKHEIISPAMRTLIGATTRITPERETGRIFDISDTTAHVIKDGRVGSHTEARDGYAPRNKEVKKIDDKLAPINELALDRLASSLSRITDSKLEDEDAKDLSSIARNLSGIVKDTSPKAVDEDGGEKYQFQIFAPQTIRESTYVIVEA